MYIRILGAHNRETLTSKCACLLVDDKLAVDVGSLTASLSISAQQDLEAILLTHGHFDHVRDIPILALNLFSKGADIDVYATRDVCNIIETHILNGELYPRFQEIPAAKPTIRFKPVEAYGPEAINGYSILPVPVNHSKSAVGYQISDADGNSVFYSGDTGPNLQNCWQHLSPTLLIVEVTFPDSHGDFAKNTGHLTPGFLKDELACFQELKGYLPQIITIHMDPDLEKEIEGELAAVAVSLRTPITLAKEGMQVQIQANCVKYLPVLHYAGVSLTCPHKEYHSLSQSYRYNSLGSG